MKLEELNKKHEAETQEWKNKLADIETTELEKALIRHIIFQRVEAFYRVEEKLNTARLNRKGGMMKVNIYEGFNPVDPESMRFIAWLREFDEIMLENIPEESDFSYTTETGVSLYWEYYINDESPDDCAEAELSYMDFD